MKSSESVGPALPARPSNGIHFKTGLVPFNMGSACAELCGSDFPICFAASVAGPTITIGLINSTVNVSEIIGGTITVTNSTGATLFQSSVATGLVDENINRVLVSGILEPSATVKGGSFAFFIGAGAASDVSFAIVDAVPGPEPSALEHLLLGGRPARPRGNGETQAPARDLSPDLA